MEDQDPTTAEVKAKLEQQAEQRRENNARNGRQTYPAALRAREDDNDVEFSPRGQDTSVFDDLWGE